MAKLSKRYSAVRAKVDRTKVYPAQEALELAKACATAKFKESVDVAVQLGIDAKKSDQLVRGSIVLPAGTGKTSRVAVFAQGEKAEAAKAAGADIVGMEDLAERIKAGQIDFDIRDCVAGHHAYRWYVGSNLGPARPDAKPQGGHGIGRRGPGGEKCQGRSGSVPHR